MSRLVLEVQKLAFLAIIGAAVADRFKDRRVCAEILIRFI
jgi:hypothetical protein